MNRNFIGKPLKEVEFILKKDDIKYIITRTEGGKDSDILDEELVICVRNNVPLEIIVTKFKITI